MKTLRLVSVGVMFAGCGSSGDTIDRLQADLLGSDPAALRSCEHHFRPGAQRRRCIRDACHHGRGCRHDGGIPDGTSDAAGSDASSPPDAVSPQDASIDTALDAADTALDSGSSDEGSDGGGPPICVQSSPDSVWATIRGSGIPTTIQAIAPGEVWGISVGKLQRWDGSTWTPVAVPFTWAATQGVVRGSGASNVWATNGEARIARWDGQSWTDVSPSLPASSVVTEMRTLGPNNTWIVNKLPAPIGSPYFSQSTVVHWDGTAWAEIPLPTEANSITDLRAIWTTSPDDVWVGGARYLATRTERILLHWDGAALSNQPFGTLPNDGQGVGGIWASSAHDVWVVGGSGTGDGRLLHYDGAVWTELLVREVTTAFHGVWGWCATNVWAIAYQQIWHYDGTSWSMVLANNASLRDLTSISGTGPDEAWVSGTDALGAALMMELQPSTCGDEVVGVGEECDPPRELGSAGVPVCDQSCHIPTCGNLALDPGETCDPPNDRTCDRQCQIIPNTCGNGILESGESCDAPESILCHSCQSTACGRCYSAMCRSGSICGALTGTDQVDCTRLVYCAGANAFSCPSLGACYCMGDPACAPRPGAPCRAEIEAVAHSTDPVEVVRQMGDPSTILYAVSGAASCMSFGGCGPICAGIIPF